MSSKIEDYDVLDVIGSGSFGTCFKVRHKITRNLFVWKAIDYGKLSEDSKKNLVSEVNLLSKLDHPNIVKYFDRILHKETTTLYIITEWCQGGDLAKLVRSAKSTGQVLKEDFIWRVLYQVSKAIQVCHTTLCQFTVLHRDIKPANVFLDGEGNAKLGDFGLARVVDSEDECTPTLVGTPYYMSPEVVRGHRYNRKSDIWALGCLVYELCALSPPFVGPSLKDLQSKIKSGKYSPIPGHYSDNLVKVISFMLSVKHEYRPTIEMILHHPLVVQNIKSFQKPHKRVEEKSIENICVDALKNLSLATEPEDVTQNLFKEKWMSRLEALREREAMLKEKECGLAAKERTLKVKERHLVMKERKTDDRMALAEVFMNRRRDPRMSAMMNTSGDTEFSADPGDTSVLPTSTKLDLNRLPQPKFTRSKSERRTKKVTFTNERRKAHNLMSGRPESSSGKSGSSDNSGTTVSFPREPLRTLQYDQRRSRPSGSVHTLTSENSTNHPQTHANILRSSANHKSSSTLFKIPSNYNPSTSAKSLWPPKNPHHDKENITVFPQNTDGAVITSRKKSEKTFQLFTFL